MDVFFTAITPLILVVNYAYFFSIHQWLHELDGYGSETRVNLWYICTLCLCIGGRLVAGKQKRPVLKYVYGVLLGIGFLLILFLGVMAGAGSGVKT